MTATITLNGLALLIWFAALVVTGATCYVWGRMDGKGGAE